MRLVLQPTSTWRLPITARSACAAPSRWRIGCSSFGSTRPSRASRSASRRSLLLVPPWISRTAWACAVITSCPSSSSNRCTHGEWLPTSITTRQRAIPSNRLRIARAVVAIRPSSLTSPCSSTTQSWLYRSPRSTPIVSRGPTLVSSFMVGLRSWASEPVDVSWGSYVDTPQTEVDLLIPSRTLRHSSDSSDTRKGNELAKSFVRCLSPVALKSLGPLALLGSTPTPGTLFSAACARSQRKGWNVPREHHVHLGVHDPLRLYGFQFEKGARADDHGRPHAAVLEKLLLDSREFTRPFLIGGRHIITMNEFASASDVRAHAPRHLRPFSD